MAPQQRFERECQTRSSLLEVSSAGREFPGVEAALGALTAVVVDEPTVARIEATEFVVPEGSTVVLSHPLNHLKFDNVAIKGVLVCQGDTVIECENLS